MNDLFSWTPPDTDRHGETFVHEFDYKRLNAQQRRVWLAVAGGAWLTLREISDVTGDPEPSISARLRDLRNMFKLTVERRRRGEEKRGLHEYRVTTPGGKGSPL